MHLQLPKVLRHIGLPEPKEVIDGGASVGNITLLYLKLFPYARIHAFEPHPSVFQTLVDRVRRTAMAQGRQVVFNNTALGLSKTTVDLYCNHYTPASSSFPIDPKWGGSYPGTGKSTGKITVPCKGLTDYVDGLGVETIDLLKLDVQGSEVLALESGANLLDKRRIRAVLSEVMFIPFYKGAPLAHEIFGFLEGFGYYPYRIWPGQPASNGSLRHADVLFTHPEI